MSPLFLVFALYVVIPALALLVTPLFFAAPRFVQLSDGTPVDVTKGVAWSVRLASIHEAFTTGKHETRTERTEPKRAPIPEVAPAYRAIAYCGFSI